MAVLWQDIRYGLRMLAKSPGFTAVAVLSLALGIGANTAVFSALNAVLLRSLPVRNPHELRLINWVGRNPQYSGYNGPGTSDVPGGFTMGTSFSYPAYCTLRDGSKGFAGVFAFSSPRSVTVVGHGEPSHAGALLVSGNYFSGYGVGPLIGRAIVPEDDRPDAAPVAVISYRWWQQHCGSKPDTIGQTVSINKTTFTVVGVLPRDYLGPTSGDSTDILVPLSSQPQIWPTRLLNSPDQWWVQIMGRLAPGADEAQAQAGLSVLFHQSLGLSKTKMDEGGILLEDGSRGQLMLRRQLAKPFFLLTAVVGVVLLIACANLAGLLLTRGAARRHEMAVRAAMGAGRWRLIRQSLIESLVLSLIGAVLGLVVAVLGRQSLLGFLAWNQESSRFDLRTDTHVLSFTFAITVFTSLVFGILPAIRVSRTDPAHALKNRSALGAPRLVLGKVLVAVQVGLSVLLVIGAGLMIRTFVNLARVAPGFDPENTLLFRVRPADAGYDEQRFIDVYDRIRTALVAIPGVQAVTFSGFPLVSGTSSSDFIEFQGGGSEAGQKLLTNYLEVGDDFLHTMNIPLLLGRDLNAADNAGSSPVAIVNQTFARHYFPGENAVGKTFISYHPTTRTVQIVGVAGDTKYNRVRADIPPLMYLSQRQYASRAVSFAVRSALPPFSLLPAVRRAVAAVDSDLPLSMVRTQEQVLDESVAADRLFASLGGALAFLAILLSCIGLYGLMAYNVARRTQEIGLRMALGATRRNVAAPVLREALLLTLIGLAVGVPVTLALTRFIKSQLYGVAPADPITLAIGGALLVVVALLSAWIPARRATKIDPMVALRCE
jgi:predicted permease